MDSPVNDEPLTTSNSDVIDRLARLRALLPAMATDLAVARRRASALAAENDRLARRVRELESRLGGTRRRRLRAGAPQ
jgi:hypothetical protein